LAINFYADMSRLKRRRVEFESSCFIKNGWKNTPKLLHKALSRMLKLGGGRGKE